MTAPDSTESARGVATPDTPSRPARPARPPGYWERIDRIVAAAPPLTDEQRATLRAIFHAPQAPRREAA